MSVRAQSPKVISQVLQQYDMAEPSTFQKCEPRVCFLSLFYLYQSWENIPVGILNNSLFLLNCRRECIIPSPQSNNRSRPYSPRFAIPNGTQMSMHMSDEMSTSEQQDVMSSTVKSDDEDDKMAAECGSNQKMIARYQMDKNEFFIQLLLHKEKQNRILWLEDIRTDVDIDVTMNRINLNGSKPNFTVNSKWHFISDWLSSHHLDPMVGTKFHPILTHKATWKQKFRDQLKLVKDPPHRIHWWDTLSQFEHCTDYKSIGLELKHAQFKFKAMAEILHQSNPTLVPMAKWNNQKWQNKILLISKLLDSADDCYDTNSITHNTFDPQSSRALFGVFDNEGTVFLT